MLTNPLSSLDRRNRFLANIDKRKDIPTLTIKIRINPKRKSLALSNPINTGVSSAMPTIKELVKRR